MTPAAAQHLENVTVYARHLGLDLSGLTLDRVDIAYTLGPDGKEATMSEVIFKGQLDALANSIDFDEFSDPLPGTHSGYASNIRQNVLRWSMQINTNQTERRLSIDIDRWNPNYGVLGAFMHGCEVIYDKCAAVDTDPRAVAQALRKMGLTVKDCFK